MSNQRLVAVEPLSWSEFSKKYKLLELEKCLLGGRLPNLREEYFALTEECPEQMASFAGAPGLESLRPSGIDEGAIVLFPFSLNHMIPEVVEGEFWQTAAGTLERLRQRSTAIVIVESAGWPHYPDLQGALQSRGYARFCKNPMNEKLLAQPDILSAPDEVKRYNLYPDPDVTRYRAHRSYSEVRVLWADARGWHLSLERSG